MILAGGLGTRLGELGKETPKVLLKIKGETLLGRHLRYLEKESIEHVVINVHHHADKIRDFLDEYKGPLKITTIEEQPNLLGTAGAVYNALPFLGSAPFLVIYGDIFFTSLHLKQVKSATTIGVYPGDAKGMGTVRLWKWGRVIEFTEKGTEERGIINAGIYILGRDIIPLLKPNTDFGYDTFPKALEEGIEIYAKYIPPVVDIGTPERLESVL